ncbi:MAG TPA: tRNA-binding protein, partial [Thermoplasmata archaeon]|nr:tRNA-binding protein [Thermoplasmata archaeon]
TPPRRMAAGDRRQSDGPDPMALTWNEFRKVDIRVGRILDAGDFPEARNPSYKLTVDFGPLGVKRTSAAILPWYTKEDLVGRSVVAVVNFPPKQIANFRSEVLVLGAVQADGRVILLRPDEEGELGARVA